MFISNRMKNHNIGIEDEVNKGREDMRDIDDMFT